MFRQSLLRATPAYLMPACAIFFSSFFCHDVKASDLNSKIDILSNLSDMRQRTLLEPESQLFEARVLGIAATETLDTFGVNLSLPGNYNSNADQLKNGGRASFETDPELNLTWTHKFQGSQFELDGSLETDLDQFPSAGSANQDKMSGSMKLQYNDTMGFLPSISYAPAVISQNAYSKWLGTANDIDLGVDKSFSLGKGYKIEIPFVLQRREFAGQVSSFAGLASPSISYAISSAWAASLELDETYRSFDKFQGASRQDWVTSPLLTIKYKPTISGGDNKSSVSPEIDLQLLYTNQSSNISTDSYQQWSVGATLSASWSF